MTLVPTTFKSKFEKSPIKVRIARTKTRGKRRLEEEEEKVRAVVERLEVQVRKSFSGNFARIGGSSDGVDGQTVDQACAESSTVDKPACGAKKSYSTTPTLTDTASSESKTSGAQVAKTASASHLSIDISVFQSAPCQARKEHPVLPHVHPETLLNERLIWQCFWMHFRAAWFDSISDNKVVFRTGSTAVTALVIGDHLVVANDSRVVPYAFRHVYCTGH